jgi:hypothetical protein
MRLQPGSGIAAQDAPPILRFLHYYTLEQQRLKRQRAAAEVKAAMYPDAATEDSRAATDGGTAN